MCIRDSDKPMVIHTKEKAKIHSHEPKGARIKGSNIYTVERDPKIAGSKAVESTGKKSYRKSTVHQANLKEKGLMCIRDRYRAGLCSSRLIPRCAVLCYRFLLGKHRCKR